MILKGREEVYEAIETADEVACEPWRWGTTRTFVLRRDGKYFRFSAQFHSQDGLQVDQVDLVEVKPVTKMVTEWVPA